MVFPVMMAIVEAKNQIQMDTRYRIGQQSKLEQDHRLFLELLTGKITQEEEAEHRCLALHWPSAPVRMITIQLEDKGRNSTLLEMKREGQIRETRRISGLSLSSWSSRYQKKILFLYYRCRCTQRAFIKDFSGICRKNKRIKQQRLLCSSK